MKKNNKKYFIGCLIVIIILAVLLLFFYKTNTKFIEINYNRLIQYNDGTTLYKIYQKKDNIVVYYDEQVICITDPCNPVEQVNNIQFSKKNMQVIYEFMNTMFENKTENDITITDEDLTIKQKNIIKSITRNDETFMNNDRYNVYKVVTNLWCQTMLNDGGSHTSSYYNFNFKTNIVEKYESYYKAFEDTKQESLVFSKEIPKSLSSKIQNTLNLLLYKEDYKENNDCPFSITYGEDEKVIYSLESINSLTELLEQIDKE